ncbi:oligogalacturonate lyase [Edaphobacter sp. HDX4]|uniref:oligogalacturonate lyase family protein n=1 Tax=Edaphobacter sp. HDX4 TaxID=2794064 RepID=UPI002FE65F37
MQFSPARNILFTTSVFVMACALLFAQARRDTRPADKMPTQEEIKNPPKTWIDKDTGHRVTRLTNEPGSASFYFNVNGYTPDGTEMVYTTPEGINVLNLQTHATRNVVKGKVRTMEVGHKTPTIFYIKTDEDAIYKTNLKTGETKMLAKVPPRGRVITVNADETLAAGTYDEVDKPNEQFGQNGGRQASPGSPQTSPLEQAANKGEMMERRLAARIPLVLFTIDLTGSGKITPLLHSTDWVNHLLFSPTDPKILMYCHEGPWQKVDRIWTIHTDGTHNQLMHQRHMPGEIAGHEFWGKDGETVYYDLQTPKGEDFWLASVNVKTDKRIWYHMQRDEWSIHFNVNKDATLFTGDGGDPHQVAKASNGEWIYLFHPEILKTNGITNDSWPTPGVFHAERLVNMSKHNYTLEPNVSFTPDGKMIIFRSNMFGPTYVFGVDIAKEK